MSTSTRIGRWGLVVLLAAVAAGCGGNSFIGQRFNNFTAYYNTFYNAQQAYQQGVSAIEGSLQSVDRNRYMTIFSAGTPGGNVTFQSAIEKGADVLRDHPNSKWVDDALLLIGKSYFYQENYVGAEQKFREVLDLDSPLDGEARIWLARTLIVAGALDEARDHLATSIEQTEEADRWTAQLHLALGELFVKEEDFAEAADELEAGLDAVADHDLRARALFLLGQVNETLGRYEEAVAAYDLVAHEHPRYELSYAADLSGVRVQGLHVDADGALEKLRRMERDGKNYTNRFEIAYMRGRILQSENRPQEARLVYRDLLYDSESPPNIVQGRVHYALGELYRDAFDEYIVAAAHFDTARTSLSSQTALNRGDGAPQYAPEAITDAPYQAEVFRSFAGVRTRIARMDSLLALGGLSQTAFEERILEIRRQRGAELAEQERRAAQAAAERSFQNAAGQVPTRSTSTAAQNTGQSGFLFHRDPVRVQEARMNFIDRWGERPLVPNWRRSQAVAAATADAANVPEQPGGGVSGVDPGVGENPLPEIDYSDVPRDSQARAVMRGERALARYELGNVLFLSMNRPDSAATWYRMVVEEDSDEDVAQRAFYALAEVQRSLGDDVTATRLYEQVLQDYPESDFAGRVRDQLGLPQLMPSDSLTVAMAEYDAAYERWRRGSYGSALDSMVTVAARHPHSQIAPKALFAAGRIYMEWARADSMDLFGPLPLTVADSVIEKAGLFSKADPSGAGNEDAAAGGVAGQSLLQDAHAPRRRVENANAELVVPDGAAATPLSEAGGEGAVAPLTGEASGGAEEDEARPAAGEEERRSAQTPGDAIDAIDVLDAVGAEQDGDGAGLEEPDSTGTDDVPSDPSNAERTASDSLGIDPNVSNSTGIDSDVSDSTDIDLIAPDSISGEGVVTDTTYGVAAGDTTGQDGAGADAFASADSLATPFVMEPDTSSLIASADLNEVYLQAIYSSVRDHYPETQYAEEASRMLDALDQRRRQSYMPDVDSTSVLLQAAQLGAPGVLLAQSLTRADSTTVDAVGLSPSDTTSVSQVAGRPDTAMAPVSSNADPAEQPSSKGDESTVRAGSEDVLTESIRAGVESPEDIPTDGESRGGVPIEGMPTGDVSLYGEGGIRSELGGFTIVVGVDVEPEPVRELARSYADRGYRIDVLEMDLGGTTVYRAGLGQFPSEEAAATALEALQDELDGTGQIAPLGER